MKNYVKYIILDVLSHNIVSVNRIQPIQDCLENQNMGHHKLYRFHSSRQRIYQFRSGTVHKTGSTRLHTRSSYVNSSSIHSCFKRQRNLNLTSF